MIRTWLLSLCLGATSALAADFETRFAALESCARCRVGVAALDSRTGKRIEHRAQERFLMCSTFKLLAVAAVLKRVDDGREQLDRMVPYGEKDLLAYAPVTRAHVRDGCMTLGALCAAAIAQSDNTAANLILDSIGGPQGVTAFARVLGDNVTRLDRKEPELNTVARDWDWDTTSPASIANDLQRLLTTDVLSSTSRQQLESWLQQNETGAGMIRASVPADWKVGDKTGRSADGATNDVAILRPPNGGPTFIAVYTVAPPLPPEQRAHTVAEAAKIALEALAK